jgi:drug/metabolite transporter (DMT)-like permease
VENLDSSLIGYTAAVSTSFLWAVNSIFFERAVKRIGAVSVNAYRIFLAAILLAVTHTILFGLPLPKASNGQWLWLGLSGIVGLGVGDFGLFAALDIMGPRRLTVMMTLSPIFASLVAYLMLGETISPMAAFGIAITLTGVILATLEKDTRIERGLFSGGLNAWGVFFALVGAIGQGVGIVLAKMGMYFDSNAVINPLSAALMRMLAGALFVWTCVLASGKRLEVQRAISNKEGVKFTVLGAFIGPFVGVTLSMVAVARAHAGVAQTLMSLMPIIIIPLMWGLYGQKTGWRGILGAVVAVIGVAILFVT